MLDFFFSQIADFVKFYQKLPIFILLKNFHFFLQKCQFFILSNTSKSGQSAFLNILQKIWTKWKANIDSFQKVLESWIKIWLFLLNL